MVTRILILWLLAEQPLHGYRIKKILGDPSLGFWFPVEDASIYSMLRSLEKAGLAREAGQEREGKRPNRVLYAITRSGRRALRERLQEAWLATRRGPEAISAALAAADEFEDAEIAELLRDRLAAVAGRREELRRVAPGAPSRLLARREQALLEAELRWLRRELGTLDETNA